VHIQVKDPQVVLHRDLFSGMGHDEKSKGKKLYDSMHKNKIDQVGGLLRNSKITIEDENININNVR
jgi:hypothetical protein